MTSANKISISDTKIPDKKAVIQLYKKLEWSAADRPNQLYNALTESHSLITAWDEERLIGLGNAISDGHLVVYYPHLLVDPDYQKMGIGQRIMDKMQDRYNGFHMQMLTSDQFAESFYSKMGFSRAGNTIPMWIYGGSEH